MRLGKDEEWCPDCGGDGGGYIDRYAGNGSVMDKWVDCDACNGAGVVESDEVSA